MTCVRYDADGWGVGELWLDARRVVWHESPRPAAAAPNPHPGWGRTRRPLQPSVAGETSGHRADSVPDLVERLRAFFAGGDVRFDDVALDLDELTPFERACAGALRGVARGDVVTYGELAALAGAPGAARAAGTFCARNRHSVFVPCHRVVSAHGIGGYGSLGVEYKRRLLALEGVAL